MGWTSKAFKGEHLNLTEKQIKEILMDEYVGHGYSFAMIHFDQALDIYDHNVLYC